MKRISEIEKIQAPLFIVGLITLLLNDFYFKYSFPSELTGKLSDIAGLFIFPYFFSALRPQLKKKIYWATAAAFIVWKTPFSQPLIDYGNNIGIGINRTIDYLDLFTLLILPLSFKYFNFVNSQVVTLRKPLIVILASASLFSFMATTLPMQEVKLDTNTDKKFVLKMNKEEFFKRISPAHDYSDTLQKNLSDSLFYLYFNVPELKADVVALAKIKENSANRLSIKLDSIISSSVTGNLFGRVDQKKLDKVKSLKSNEFEDYFEKYFVNKVKNSSEENHLFYDNKFIHDSYENHK